MTIQFASWPALLWIALTVSACGPNQTAIGDGSREPVDHPAVISRFIIGFHTDPKIPDSPAFLADLSAAAGVTLRYVRPLSPSVHLFSTIDPLDPKARNGVIAQLSGRRDIRYIEYDWPMHHMNSGQQKGGSPVQ